MNSSKTTVHSQTTGLSASSFGSPYYDGTFFSILCLIVIASYSIYITLLIDGVDVWSDIKGTKFWVERLLVLAIIIPAMLQAFLWNTFRLPFGATLSALALTFVNFFDFYDAYVLYPKNFTFSSVFVPAALFLDSVLLLTGSYLCTAVLGGVIWPCLIFFATWPIVMGLQDIVEYHGSHLTLADLQGYQYIRSWGNVLFWNDYDSNSLYTNLVFQDTLVLAVSGFKCTLVSFLAHAYIYCWVFNTSLSHHRLLFIPYDLPRTITFLYLLPREITFLLFIVIFIPAVLINPSLGTSDIFWPIWAGFTVLLSLKIASMLCARLWVNEMVSWLCLSYFLCGLIIYIESILLLFWIVLNLAW